MSVNAKSIADRISSALPNVKAGSLRMWGEWFGKPHDNFHTIKGCSSTGSALILQFDGGETLTVENPEGLELSNTLFSIRSASAVQWEWFYYGRPHIADNRYYYRFTRNGVFVEAQSNVDWYKPEFSPSSDNNAAELL
jgi:hypothetical protein